MARPPKERVPGTQLGTGLMVRATRTTGTKIFQAPSVSKEAGDFTRFGARMFSQGPLGNFTGRVETAPTIIDLPIGHLTFTPNALQNPLQDTVVDLPAAIDDTYTPAGTGFSVSQSGGVIDLPVGNFTLTGLAFIVDQLNSGDQDVFLPSQHITFTGLPFVVQEDRIIDIPTGHVRFTPLEFTVAITLPGPQTLTQGDINAIWGNFAIGGSYSPEATLEIIAAAVAGRLRDVPDFGRPGTMVFRDIANTRDVIIATVDEKGDRVTIVLSP